MVATTDELSQVYPLSRFVQHPHTSLNQEAYRQWLMLRTTPRFNTVWVDTLTHELVIQPTEEDTTWYRLQLSTDTVKLETLEGDQLNFSHEVMCYSQATLTIEITEGYWFRIIIDPDSTIENQVKHYYVYDPFKKQYHSISTMLRNLLK